MPRLLSDVSYRSASIHLAQAALNRLRATSVTDQEYQRLAYMRAYERAYLVFHTPISGEVNQVLPALAHFAYVHLITLQSGDHSIEALSDYFYQHMLNQRSEPEPEPEPASDSDSDSTPPLTP